MYDSTQGHIENDACWQELITNRHFYLSIQDIYIGPQGAAAAVTLPSELYLGSTSPTLHLT